MKKKFLAAFAVVAIMFGVTPAAPSVAAGPIIDSQVIVAHKAGPLDAPENTTQAIIMAKQKNPALKWIEVDVRWNKSDFPFLMHDPTVDATTDKAGNLNTYWYPQVQDMNAASYGPWDDKNTNGTWKYPQYHGKYLGGDGVSRDVTHPPYASEFLYEANRAGFNVLMDVKETPTQVEADKLYSYIEARNYQDKVVYMASPESIKAMRTYHPDLEYFVIEYPAAGMMRTATSLKAIGADGYSVRQDNITKEFVDYYHSNGIKVFSWTTDSVAMDVAANWDKVLDAGTDGLITNQHVAATTDLNTP